MTIIPSDPPARDLRLSVIKPQFMHWWQSYIGTYTAHSFENYISLHKVLKLVTSSIHAKVHVMHVIFGYQVISKDILKMTRSPESFPVGPIEQKGLHEQPSHHQQPQETTCQETAAIPEHMTCIHHFGALCPAVSRHWGQPLSASYVMGHSFTRTEVRTYIIWTPSVHNSTFLIGSLGREQDDHHGMTEKNHKKLERQPLPGCKLNRVFPEYEHMVSPLTERLQMQHWKTSFLQTKQLGPLTWLLQYWHSE
jgi:hypothetical protein